MSIKRQGDSMSKIDDEIKKESRKEVTKLVFFIALPFLVLFLLLFSLAGCGAYMEAKAYNKITGSNITAWQALFVELRVQDGAIKQ